TAEYFNFSSQLSVRPAEVKLSCSGKTEPVGSFTSMMASATARSLPSEGELTTPSPLIHIVVEPPLSSASASVAPTVLCRNVAKPFQLIPMLELCRPSTVMKKMFVLFQASTVCGSSVVPVCTGTPFESRYPLPLSAKLHQ